MKHAKFNLLEKKAEFCCFIMFVFALVVSITFAWTAINANADDVTVSPANEAQTNPEVPAADEQGAPLPEKESATEGTEETVVPEATPAQPEKKVDETLNLSEQVSSLLGLNGSLNGEGFDWDATSGALTIQSNAGIANWVDEVSNDKTLPGKVKSIIFAEAVTEIPSGSFSSTTDTTGTDIEALQYSNLESVVFNGDIIINDFNFCWVTKLQSVDFKGTSKIYGNVFTRVSSLEYLNFAKKTEIPSGNAFIVKEFGVNSSGEYDETVILYDIPNDKLTTLSIPANSIVKSGGFRFYNVIEQVDIGDNAVIGGNFLSDCPLLNTVNIQGTIEMFNCAFCRDISITTLTFPEETKFGSLYSSDGSDPSSGCFGGCYSISKITFNKDCLILNGGPFCGMCKTDQSADSLEIVFKGRLVSGSSSISTGSCFANNYHNDIKVSFEDESIFWGTGFDECPNISELNFNKAVTIKHSGAFSCSGYYPPNNKLKSLVFPLGTKFDFNFSPYNTSDGATSGLFNNYKALESVTFKDDIEINCGSFQNCSNLEKLQFEKTSKLMFGCFTSCPKLNSLIFGDATTITRGCFSSAAPVTSLNFPKGSDLSYAAGIFTGWTTLQEVNFEGDIEIATVYKFSSGDGNKYTGGAFYSCSNLRKATFGGDCTVTSGCFAGCNNLGSIDFAGNVYFDNQSKDNDNLSAFSSYSMPSPVIPEGNDMPTIRFHKDVDVKNAHVDEGTHNSCVDCFSQLPTQQLIFDGDVKAGLCCFRYLHQCKKVFFHGSVEADTDAFLSLPNVDTMQFDKSVKCHGPNFFGDPNHNAPTTPSLIANSKLESLRFPAGTTFDDYKSSFCGLYALKHLEFESDVRVGPGHFQYSSDSLEDLKFGGTSFIGSGSFNTSGGVKSKLRILSFADKTEISAGSFQFGLTNTAPESAGYGNTDIKELVIPAGSTIGNGCLINFYGLKKLVFQGDVSTPSDSYGSFQNLVNLEELEIWGDLSVNSSSNGLFLNTHKLRKLTVGGKVNLKCAAFHSSGSGGYAPFVNTNLETLIFKDGSDISGANGLFENYAGLKNVIFEGDIVVPQAAFQGCKSLENVVFGGKSSFSGWSFSYCSNLRNITFNDAVTLNGGGIFDLNNDDDLSGKIPVPADPYPRGTVQNTALKELTFPEGSTISGCVDLFKDYIGLEKVSFNCDVELNGGSFKYCDSLKEVNFNGASTILKGGAFSHDASLSNINFSNEDGAVTELYDDVFQDCDSLEYVELPKGAKIENKSSMDPTVDKGNAFEGCANLENVIFGLGANIKFGGGFKNCPNLHNFGYILRDGGSKIVPTFAVQTFANFDPDNTTIYTLPHSLDPPTLNEFKAALSEDDPVGLSADVNEIIGPHNKEFVDADCINNGGHIGKAWEHDDTKHYQHCAYCDDKINNEEHVFDADGVCTVCHYGISVSDASDSIDAYASDVLAKINALIYLDGDEKSAYAEEIGDLVTAAKSTIEDSSVPSVRLGAIDNCKKALDDELFKAQIADKVNQVDAYLETDTDIINDCITISDAQKQIEINKLTEITNNAKADINNAKDNSEAADIVSEYIENMDKAILPVLKTNAKSIVGNKLDWAYDVISKCDWLTSDEIADYKYHVEDVANYGKQWIDTAKDKENIDQQLTNVVDRIDQTVLSLVKQLAIADLSYIQTLIGKANAFTHVTSELRDPVITGLTNIYNDAPGSIYFQTSSEAVNVVLQRVFDDADALYYPLLKTNEKNAVDETVASANSTIESMDFLTEAEVATLEGEVASIATDAKQDVDDADAEDDIIAASTTGIATINEYVDSSIREAGADNVSGYVEELKTKTEALEFVDEDAKDTTVGDLTAISSQAATDISGAADITTIPTIVGTAKSNALDNKFVPLLKTNDKNAIDSTVNEEKATIDSMDFITDKTSLKTEVDTRATTAKSNIDTATTEDAINTAMSNGISDIENYVLASIKTAGTNSVDATVDELIIKTNDLEYISEADREVALTNLNTIKTDANNDITTASSADDVKDIVTAAKEDAASVYLSAVKLNANTAIDDKQTEANNAIDSMDFLTTDQKNAFKAEVTNKVNDAKTEISEATDEDGVNNAMSNGLTNIGSYVLGSLKDAGSSCVTENIDGLIAKVNAFKFIDTTTKTTAVSSLNNTKTTALAAIEAATDSTTIANTVSPAIFAANSTYMPVLKLNAKGAVDNQNKEAGIIFDAMAFISRPNRTTYKAHATTLADTAKTNIESKPTEDGVNDAMDAGIDAIDNYVLTTVKTEGTSYVSSYVGSLADKTDALKFIDDELKATTKTSLGAVETQATTDIGNATSAYGVSATVNNATGDSDDIFIPVLKTDSKLAIENAVTEAETTIDAVTFLTEEQKTSIKSDVDDLAGAAKEDIDNAVDETEVNSATEDGIASIDAKVLSSVQTAGKTTVTDYIAALVVKAQNLESITAEERQALINALNDIKTSALTGIDGTSTVLGVSEIVDSAKIAGDALFIYFLQKDSSNVIDNTASLAGTAIDDASFLNEEEKAFLKTGVGEIADTSKQDIFNASDEDSVCGARDTGVDAIDEYVIGTIKYAGNLSVSSLVNVLIEKVKALPYLEPKDKTDATDALEAIIANAETDIEEAESVSEVSNLVAGYKNTANGIFLTALKLNANNGIDTTATMGKETIDSVDFIPEEEKAELKAEVDRLAGVAKQAIIDATDEASINKALNDGIDSIDRYVLPIIKTIGKQNVSDHVNELIGKLDNLKFISDDEKQAAVDSLNEIATNAATVIDAAENTTEVSNKLYAAIEEADNAYLSTVKVNANNAIKVTADNKKDSINALDFLNQDEKNYYFALVDSIVADTNNGISVSTTEEDVNAALQEGIDRINSIVIEPKKDDKQETSVVPASYSISQTSDYLYVIVGVLVALALACVTFIVINRIRNNKNNKK